MKRTQLVLSVLALGLTGIAQAAPFPADAEASYGMPVAGSFSSQRAGGSWDTQSAFPADAEALITVQARSSYTERHAGDVVNERAEILIATINLDD